MKIVSFKTKAVKAPRNPGPLSGGANFSPFVTLIVKTDEGIERIADALDIAKTAALLPA